MNIITTILVAIIALLHIYFLWFEMFAWESRGPKIFRQFPKNLFKSTKQLAANQGLYNGFLAAGLIWSLLIEHEAWSKQIALFFLGCVAIAGIYGAVTVSKKIVYVQAIPAIIAIFLLIF